MSCWTASATDRRSLRHSGMCSSTEAAYARPARAERPNLAVVGVASAVLRSPWRVLLSDEHPGRPARPDRRQGTGSLPHGSSSPVAFRIAVPIRRASTSETVRSRSPSASTANPRAKPASVLLSSRNVSESDSRSWNTIESCWRTRTRFSVRALRRYCPPIIGASRTKRDASSTRMSGYPRTTPGPSALSVSRNAGRVRSSSLTRRCRRAGSIPSVGR